MSTTQTDSAYVREPPTDAAHSMNSFGRWEKFLLIFHMLIFQILKTINHSTMPTRLLFHKAKHPKLFLGTLTQITLFFVQLGFQN